MCFFGSPRVPDPSPAAKPPPFPTPPSPQQASKDTGRIHKRAQMQTLASLGRGSTILGNQKLGGN